MYYKIFKVYNSQVKSLFTNVMRINIMLQTYCYKLKLQMNYKLIVA